jgi:hypothetical protein
VPFLLVMEESLYQLTNPRVGKLHNCIVRL